MLRAVQQRHQNSEDTVLSSSGPSRSEESQMSQSRMSVAGQSQFRKHRSPRILPNQVRETPSIPVRRVRKDVLLDERGCVPRFVEKERHPPLRHQGIRSGGNLRVFENLAQTLVAVDAS